MKCTLFKKLRAGQQYRLINDETTWCFEKGIDPDRHPEDQVWLILSPYKADKSPTPTDPTPAQPALAALKSLYAKRDAILKEIAEIQNFLAANGSWVNDEKNR